VGKQQLIEIAKALAKDVRLLILDEPTAALQENDSQKLLDLMLELKAQGVTQIIISHKLNEISRVADRITVIRDGSTVSTMDAPRSPRTASSATWWAATWRTATPSGCRRPARC
jgi:putative multiple sugar transport system ATP-binding protein